MKAPLLDKIEETFSSSPATLQAIKRIANDIVETGMSIDECATIAGLDPVALETVYALSPETEEYFKLKRLQYKADALRFINRSARAKEDIKTVLALMERSYPNEFDPSINRIRAKNDLSSREDQENKLVQVFQFIQQTSDTTSLIKHHEHQEVLPEATKSPFPWKSSTSKNT